MVNELVLFSAITLVIVMAIVIYKKPEVIKKDAKKPLSISNFSLKKSFIGDWKSFLIWILLMFLVWSYAHDTQACRELIQDIDNVCRERLNAQSEVWFNDDYLNEIKFVGDDNGRIEGGGYNQPGSPNLIPPNS